MAGIGVGRNWCQFIFRGGRAPPALASVGNQSITAGLTYVYQLSAMGATGFTLMGAVPSGMSVDSSGRITWSTTTADLVNGQATNYTIEAEANGADGLTSPPVSYTLTLNPDTTPPTVQVRMSTNPADINSVVYVDVIASDPGGNWCQFILCAVQSRGSSAGANPVWQLGRSSQ